MDRDYTAYVADARDAYRLYETMRTNELIDLRTAFTLDQARAMTPESIAFGGGRLALIADILGKRGVRPEHATLASITCPICRRVSYNLQDIANRYCGACHRFHDNQVSESTR